MDLTIGVKTQGISDDWSRADGDFSVKSRGLLKADEMLSAMLHLAPLDTPNGADPCPPQIIARARSGANSFIGQGGTIYCPEMDTVLTARQACDLAFGKLPSAPRQPMPARSGSGLLASPTQAVLPTRKKRKFGWRGGIVLFLSLCFLLGAVVMVFGVSSMRDRGMPGDDILAAKTISAGLGLIGVLLLALAFKARRAEFYNDSGARVNEDGSALPFISMGQSLGSYDDGDDGFDGDFD